MEIAVCRYEKDMLKILLEYKEMPDSVKLVQMYELMSSAKTAAANMEEVEAEKFKMEFREILHSLSSVEMVRYCNCSNLTLIKVSTKNVRGRGTILQLAVLESMQDFARMLLEFGWVNFPT